MSERRKSNRDFRALTTVLLVTVLVSTMTSAFTLGPSTAQAVTYEKFGPRVGSILFEVYPSYDVVIQALVDEEVDIVDWPLDFATYNIVKTMPDRFVTYPLTLYDRYNLEMNCMKWPTSDANFRRAIAHLVDKETFYVDQLKSFSGVLVDSPIAEEWTQWYNPNVRQYPFNRTRAAEILDAAGYSDWDGDNIREYKNATGVYELPSLAFYVALDDPNRLIFSTDYVAPELSQMGIPVSVSPVHVTEARAAVMIYPYTYHMYMGGWGPNRDPDFLYDCYHSKFGVGWLPRSWAPNYGFFTNSTFDYWAEKLKFAANYEEAVEPCMKCQEILMDQVPFVPGWHSAGAMGQKKYYGYWSGEEEYWDKPWTGMVNTEMISGMSTSGVNGWWSFLNAHVGEWERGGTIRYGFVSDYVALNPVHADCYWDWEVLNKIYDFLILADPYTGVDIPWMAKSWVAETWDYGGKPASKFTFNLLENILWHDNSLFTSADVEFTLKYMNDTYSALFYPCVADIDHIDTPDAYTVTVYYKIQSIWALHWLGTVPMIPKHIWEEIPPSQSRENGEFETTGKLTGSGPFRFVSRSIGKWLLLTDNPTYYRKIVRPDFYSVGQPVPTHDGDVDIDDLGMAIGHILCSYPWPHPDKDPWCDVNKDLIVDIDDIMEIGVRYLRTEYYPYWQGYPNYYAP